MTDEAWEAFQKIRSRYRALIDKTTSALPEFAVLIQQLVDSRDGPSYTVDTPVVYNRALDDITRETEIKMILVGDNPGRREQAAENRRYLVGPSGKIAENFFRNNPGLGIDFRKNVLILNKTPIHTPRTVELKELCALGGEKIKDAVITTQREMAELLKEFRTALSAKTGKPGSVAPPVWIIGYSEMKKGGIFEAYTEALKKLCGANAGFKECCYFFRHFSMNQFAIDLKQQAQPGESLAESLRRIGSAYRERVLG